MKRVSTISFALAFLAGISAANLNGQGLARTIGTGFSFGGNAYQGDDFRWQRERLRGQLAVEYFFSDYFSIELNGGASQVSGGSNQLEFRSNLLSGGITGRLALMGDRRLRPYVAAGGQIVTSELILKNGQPFTSPGGPGKPFFELPVGGGLNISLNEALMLDVRSLYHFDLSDDIDGTRGGGNDAYISVALGLSWLFRGDNDSDGDGLFSKAEKAAGTRSDNPDTDDDGLTDGEEVMQYKTDPLKADTDDDGLSDAEEIRGYKTNPRNPDTDGDGLSDGAEVNEHETNPLLADSDEDGLTDKDEVSSYGTDPKVRDSDLDDLTDEEEVRKYKTNPRSNDSDRDGISDYEEIRTYTSDPRRADTDEDGLTDGVEVNRYKTSPVLADTDKGTVSDGEEVKRGSDPLNADDDLKGAALNGARRMVLEGVSFKYASARLTSESRVVLNRAYYTMLENPTIKVEIQGYTDNSGSDSTNARLSQRRADAVRQYLIDNGIDGKRIRAVGYGKQNPIASNDTDAGRKKNRRIEFVIVD